MRSPPDRDLATPRPGLDPRVFLLTLAVFASTSASFVFAGMLEPMAVDLRVAPAAVGQLQTAYVVIASLLGPVAVQVLRRGDRRSLVLLGLGLGCACHFACALAPDYLRLLLLRGPAGLAAAILSPAAVVAAASLSPPNRRGSALAAVSGGLTLAFMLGIPLGSLVGAAFGWRATFGFAGVLAALAFVAVLVGLPRIPPPQRQAGQRVALATTWPFYATTVMTMAPAMILSLYIGPIVRVGAGVTGAGVGAFQALIGIGSLLGLLMGGRAADRGAAGGWVFRAFGVLAIGMALHLAATLSLISPGWPSWILVGVATVITAGALFSVMPVVQAQIVQATNASPLALALNTSAMGLGQALGAVLGGVALQLGGAPAAPAAALAVALVALPALAATNRAPR
jgi:predicted MFS family arabinose efflux permease